MGIAEAAVAALGEQRAIAHLRQVGEQRLLVLGVDLRAGRHLDDAVIAVGAGAVLARAVAALLRLEVLLVAVVDERVEIVDALGPDVAALAAVAAVGPAELDELLAPERQRAVAAGTRGNVDLRRIEKFHRVLLRQAPSSGRRRAYFTVFTSLRRASHHCAPAPMRRKPSLAMTRAEAGLSTKWPQVRRLKFISPKQ